MRRGERVGIEAPSNPPKGPAVGRTGLEGSVALRILRSRELIFVLVGIGMVLRVAQYAANRSLWIDEAWLALNLIERPMSGLTRSLDFNQGAPVGFLVLEKGAGQILGYSEYALRLFPLVCGLASLPLFAWLARRMLSRTAAPFAILLFVFADGLIYYSSEVKPYQTDVTVAVFLLVAGTILADDTAGQSRKAIAVAVVGLALVPLSYPAVFMVAAVAGVLAVRLVFERRRSLTSPTSLAVLLWGSAALGIAVFGATRTRLVRESFSGSGFFLGVPGSSPLHALNVMATGMAKALGLPQGRPFSHLEKLALLCALVGAVSLFRRNRTQLSMLIVPFALVMAASAAGVYPILERTDLFLLPVVILLVVEGVARIVRFAPAGAQPAVAIVLALGVAAGPVSLAGTRLVHPRTNEELRPVLEFVRDHWRPGDALYVYGGAQYAFVYYDTCNCLRLSPAGSGRQLWPVAPLRGQRSQFGPAAVTRTSAVVLGPPSGGGSKLFIADLERLRAHRRIWFLYSHVNSDSERAFVKAVLLPHLASRGTRIEAIDRAGAHAYLYEIRPRARGAG